MRKLAALPLALALLLLQLGTAFAQMSDYEIIDSYKRRHQELMGSIKAAQDLAEVATLESDVARLESDNAQHRKLLGQGLYPQTFEASVAALREQLKKSGERIAMFEESRKDKVQIAEAGKKIEEIGKLNEEYRISVERLTREVTELGARVEQLTAENTGLIEQIKGLQAEGKRDKATIAKLQELNARLTANVKVRDELVMKMMDSLFDEYAKSGLTDVQRQNLFVNAQENDYVRKIITTLDGNVSYVESALLSPQDVKLVQEEQRKLAGKWEQIKPFLGKLYPDEQVRVRDLATVDTRLADWKRSSGEATWKSIHQAFASQQIDIGPFRNAGEFHERLLAYLDEQVKSPSRETHQAFKRRVWDSPMKDQWLPIIPTDELSEKQRGDIEERIALWDKSVVAMFWRWVLVGVLGLAVVVAAAVLALRRKKPAAGSPA